MLRASGPDTSCQCMCAPRPASCAHDNPSDGLMQEGRKNIKGSVSQAKAISAQQPDKKLCLFTTPMDSDICCIARMKETKGME